MKIYRNTVILENKEEIKTLVDNMKKECNKRKDYWEGCIGCEFLKIDCNSIIKDYEEGELI